MSEYLTTEEPKNINNVWDIKNCTKNGVECACKKCNDYKCRKSECSICFECDEYWTNCPSRRQQPLNYTDTKSVLTFLKKQFENWLAICQSGKDKMLMPIGEEPTDKDWIAGEALQNGRIETYKDCISRIASLIKEIEEQDNAKISQN